MVNFLSLPTVRAPENGLVNFAPVNDAIDGNRRNMLAHRESARQDQELKMRGDEVAYQRGRDAKNDHYTQIKRGAEVAMAIQNLPDHDPAKATAWQKYLKTFGDGDHSPEELDFRTGPKLAAAAAGMYLDPRASQMKDLEIQKTQAEIGKLNRMSDGEGAYGKTGAIFQDPKSGEYYSIQFGSNGKKLIEPVGSGLTPSRGVSEVDEGVGTRIIDKATGRDVRTIPKDLAGAEQQKVIGRETGERQMSMPKASASLASANAKSQLVTQKIDEALPMVNGWSAGYGSVLSSIPATQAKDLREKITTIVANMGFEELQDMRNNSPTGGALGAIAVQELEMLQKTRASLEQAQSVPQLTKALNDLKAFYAGAAERRQKAFDATYGALPQPVPYNVPQDRGGFGNTPRSQPPQPQGAQSGFRYIGPAQ